MIQIIAFIFWLLIIPFCIGFIPAKFLSENKRSPIIIFISGYLLMWSVFEIITIPAVIWIQYNNFKFVLRWFMVAAILLAAAGILIFYLDWKKNDRKTSQTIMTTSKTLALNSFYALKKLSTESKILWLLFMGLIGFQLYMAVTRTSFDGDDAYYVVQSLAAQQSDAMYRNQPYTGRSSPLDLRHALAVFPMWVAFVAVKANMHATIVSHVVMTLVLIPFSYFIYYEIAKALFASQKENIPVFMIIMSLFQLFGNVSIYTNETFFLTRTWQGKSVAANVVIPMMFLLLLWIFNGDERKNGQDVGLWIMLVCLNMTAGVSSSLAVFLLAILLGAAAVCLMIVERDWKIPVKLGLTCIPNLIYVMLYLGLGI